MGVFQVRLNNAMAARNMSAADLARKTGLSEATISNYKYGKFEAGQRSLDKLSSALGVSVTYLIGFGDDDLTDNKNSTNPKDGAVSESRRLLDAEIEKMTDEEKEWLLKTARGIIAGRDK